jgi:hypothetical protein
MTEGLTQVYELLTSFITMSGAGALDGGLGASILHLLSLVPNDKAGLTLGRILRSLQGKQVLPRPSKQRSGDQSCKGEEGQGPGPASSPQQLGCLGRDVLDPTSTRLGALRRRCGSPSVPPPTRTVP